MNTNWINAIVMLILVMLVGCKRPDTNIMRVEIDGLNKQGFIYRYNNPNMACEYSRRALQYIEDSLPTYFDGKLRAWNNLAFACYMLSEHQRAQQFIDSVYAFNGHSPNAQIERVIAQLLDARLLQRACKIADSYQLLYSIDSSGVLSHKKGHYLYSYAQLEYFITSLTLNYNYRKGMEASVAEQVAYIETFKGTLPCDYAEDMAMNYALAYGYSQLCGPEDSVALNMRKSLDYCLENLKILSRPGHTCPYQLANTIQMLAFLLEDESIPQSSWVANADLWEEICSLLQSHVNINFEEEPDITLALLEVSTDIFWKLDDPYQRLGACLATARYSLNIGDTNLAQYYFSLPLQDSLIPTRFAPKFEAMLYDGLLVSGVEASREEQIEWYKTELEIRELIAQNERADFLLRTELSQSKDANHIYLIFTIILVILILALITVAVLLRRNQLALKQETVQLQEAKRKDIERIANVETCLSVLRHDVTPFVNYLQNKNLSPALRNEVLEQLIRTFTNIKNWTSLSIPTGLQFRGTQFALQEVFDSVKEELSAGQYTPTSLWVHGDRLLLHILIRNLVQNALQHSQGGFVEISALEEDTFVHIMVKDNGCGMTEEQLENLFRSDRLQNENNNHSGFGLILCRYIIKKHDDNTIRGCRIWAESALNQGTTMHFLVAKANNQN